MKAGTCAHHWLLDRLTPASDGTCRNCGARRHFDGGQPEDRQEPTFNLALYVNRRGPKARKEAAVA